MPHTQGLYFAYPINLYITWLVNRKSRKKIMNIWKCPFWWVYRLLSVPWGCECREKRSRCAKLAGKRAFSTYLPVCVWIFSKKLADSGQNTVDNEIKLRYYKTWCLKESFSEIYMGNPGLNKKIVSSVAGHISWKHHKLLETLVLKQKQNQKWIFIR